MTSQELRLLHQDLLKKIKLKEAEFDESEEQHYDGLMPFLNQVWGFHGKNNMPLWYMGIIIIHYPDLALSPRLMNSRLAKVYGFRKVLDIIESSGNIGSYIERQYKKTFEEKVLEILTKGEAAVEEQQKIRGLNRREAVEFIVTFGHVLSVNSLYTLACKEFSTIGAKLIYLNRWAGEYINKKYGSLAKYRRTKEAQIIKNISNNFYAKRLEKK